MEDTRRVECPDCGADVVFHLRAGFGIAPDVVCPRCKAKISDDAEAVATAKERLSLEEAYAIASLHTYDEIMDICRKTFSGTKPTPDEMDIMCAFTLLRSEGLPCCKPRSAQ